MMKLLILLTLFLPLAVSAENKLPPLHHVVQVDVPEAMTIPKNFLLNDKGQIDCKTCHGIKDIADIPYEEVDKKDTNFLIQGPYPELSDFCYQCHDEKQYQRNNIHILLDEQGDIKEDQCQFCHVKTPERDRSYTLEELDLRLPPQKLCIGCHLKSPHLNAFNHLVEVDDDMLQQLHETEQKQQLVLPLDGRKILCVTCHTSHEKGVIEAKQASQQVQDRDLAKGIGYQDHDWNEVVQRDKQKRLDELNKDTDHNLTISYQRLEFEVLLRLPAKDGKLCLACHQFDQ
jgi:hypothetical protein